MFPQQPHAKSYLGLWDSVSIFFVPYYLSENTFVHICPKEDFPRQLL